jgi:hypothetical protein
VASALCSFSVGERVVSRCDGGLLEAEFALFDPAEVLVSSAEGLGVRERGYLTTAGFARARLYAAGVTPALARDAFNALRARHLRALARTPSVLRVIDQLGPYEVFEGGVYRVERETYEGTWIDLAALSGACPLRGAALMFQALHLVLAVEEVRDETPVHLTTSRMTVERRSNERTWRRVDLEAAPRLPAVLATMRVPQRSAQDAPSEASISEVLVRGLRGRCAASNISQPRLRALAAILSGRSSTTSQAAVQRTDEPKRPSSSHPPPRSPEFIVADRTDESPNPLPAFEELRFQTELLQGEDYLRAVAQSLTAGANRPSALPEVAVLAARAWLAAGERGYARNLARQVAENEAAPDTVRLTALELLESTATTNESTYPPPVEVDAPIVPTRIVVLSEPPPPAAMAPAVVATAVLDASWEPPSTALAPYAPAPARPAALVRSPMMRAPGVEIVETMPLPPGATEEMVPDGEIAHEPFLARIAMTRLSRELARDYRLAYGTTLTVDSSAIESMQRHLRRRFGDAKGDRASTRRLDAELTQHGALLSEIFARLLGAEWVDVSSNVLGEWAMLVPPETRVWPIWRAFNFYRQAARGGDLLGFFLELQTGVRRTSKRPDR